MFLLLLHFIIFCRAACIVISLSSHFLIKSQKRDIGPYNVNTDDQWRLIGFAYRDGMEEKERAPRNYHFFYGGNYDACYGK